MLRRRLLALLLGLGVAGAPVLAAERAFRRDEASLVYLWDSGRLFATRPGVGGSNSRSFHERELPAAPAPDRVRVAVLGDSMTWGTGPAEEAWPRLVEATLGPPWEVLNFSHYGYDTAQAAAVLREEVWPFAPDLVVYATYTNDPMRSRIIDVGGRPVWIARDGLLPSPLRRASALARRLEGALLARSVTEEPEWAFYDGALRGMADDARSHGVPLVVLGLVPHVLADPDLAACGARLGDPERCERHAAIAAEQERIVRALGIPFTSVLPAFRASGRPDFYPSDATDWQHPGPEGHALVATVAAPLFLATGIGDG